MMAVSAFALWILAPAPAPAPASVPAPAPAPAPDPGPSSSPWLLTLLTLHLPPLSSPLSPPSLLLLGQSLLIRRRRSEGPEA